MKESSACQSIKGNYYYSSIKITPPTNIYVNIIKVGDLPVVKRAKVRNKNFAKTKIVCTIGPKSEDEGTIEEMIITGMDVARLNFSHGTHEWHQKVFERIRTLSDEIAILFDLQGPKIRLGEIEGQITLTRGQDIILTTEDILGKENRFSVSLKTLPETLKKNDLIYINDGIISLRVLKVEETEIFCRVLSSGIISSKKGINIPNVELNVPCLTTKDKNDLAFALSLEPDYLALSFVRIAEDVKALRALINEEGLTIPIISKIEHAFAVRNFDAILKETDAIMVARGDLGIETPVEKLPLLQKELIRKCNFAGKPVITATQMLESMTNNPRPTRAEVNDVANAIFDGTDAVMLSAETAIGKYPIHAIRLMNKIALNVEKELHWRDYPKQKIPKEELVAENLATAAGMLVEKMPVKGIIAFTEGGFSARLIAKHRPSARIFVATPSKKVVRELGLIWGCLPLLVKEYQNIDQMVVETVNYAKNIGYFKDDDIIIIVSGSRLSPGKTNLLRAYTVGDIPSPEEFNAIL
ncbi:MAG: pyruvate kinase [Candidatus Heimdallarchaeota archaeon]